MKLKFSLLFGLLCLSFNTFSQITLENKYPIEAIPFKLSTGNTIYTTFDRVNNIIKIYDSNHSLYKTIPVPQIANYKSIGVHYISDQTFDTNPTNLEYSVSYDPVSSGGFGKAYVYNEIGTTLLALDSAYIQSKGLINTNTGTKFILSKRLPLPVSGYDYATLVYSLPGQYFPLAIKEFGNETEALPYPNPTSNEIVIPHSFKPGEQGQINIYSSTGKLVKTYTVDGTFNNLLLDTKQLRAGNYIYQIEANGKVTGSNKFVLIK